MGVRDRRDPGFPRPPRPCACRHADGLCARRCNALLHSQRLAALCPLPLSPPSPPKPIPITIRQHFSTRSIAKMSCAPAAPSCLKELSISTQTVSPRALFRRPSSTALMLSTPIPPANPQLHTGKFSSAGCTTRARSTRRVHHSRDSVIDCWECQAIWCNPEAGARVKECGDVGTWRWVSDDRRPAVGQHASRRYVSSKNRTRGSYFHRRARSGVSAGELTTAAASRRSAAESIPPAAPAAVPRAPRQHNSAGHQPQLR